MNKIHLLKKLRKEHLFKNIKFIFIFLFMPKTAFAYLDPNSGSILIYLLVGVASSIFFPLKLRLKNIFYKMQFRERTLTIQDQKNIVFHVEGPQYWRDFLPVIKEFNNTSIKVSCFYVGDRVNFDMTSNIEFVRFNSEFEKLNYMNRLTANIVISTTPQLDVYMFKRSPRVKKYAYLFHAPTDVAFYEKHALDNYDFIFCVGPHHKTSIRHLENKRNSKEKKLLESGYPYYDTLSKNTFTCVDNDPLSILYAPSWGRRCSLKKYGTVVLDRLLTSGFKISLRLHPQSYISDKDFTKEILQYIKNKDRISLDTSSCLSQAILKTNAIISDISGVIFDYAFFSSKPIILIKTDIDVGGYEAEDLDEIWDFNSRSEIAIEISKREISGIGKIAKEYIVNYQPRNNKKIANNNIYNFTNSGYVIKSQITDIACTEFVG